VDGLAVAVAVSYSLLVLASGSCLLLAFKGGRK